MGPRKRHRSRVKSRISSKSNQSTNSDGSTMSIGINPAGSKKEIGTLRLIPEGQMPNHIIYDTIVYLLYCNAHDMVGIKQTRNIIWLPFVTLQDNGGWEQSTHDGVAMLIGKKSEELDEKLAGGLPKYVVTTLQILRVQVSVDKFVTRLAQHVSISPTPGFQCCQNTPRLQWVPFVDIMQNKITNYWGPEVKLFTSMFYKMNQANGQREKRIIHEFGLDNAMDIMMNPSRVGCSEYNLLTDNKVSGEPAMTLYQDFFEHCFPAFHMSLEAFKSYMCKYGYDPKDERWPWMFHAFEENRDGYVNFNEFLVGVVCMEPTTQSCEARTAFIFRYYDVDNDNVLNAGEFEAFVSQLHPDIEGSKLRSKINQYLSATGADKNGVTLQMFVNAIPGKIKGTESILRSPKAIIPQARAFILARLEEENRSAQLSDTLMQNANRKDRGMCPGCKVQNYDYGLHCVFLDSLGRCVKPLRIKDYTFGTENENNMSSRRYSAEFVFGIGSICNMFMDIIRDIYRKNSTAGLLSSSDERMMMLKYCTTLCENVSELVGHEDRLIKINAPATVIGNINGDWDAMFAMERILWQSVPILATSYVFLGNYTSPNSSNNVEVLIYLMALKMLSPNQILLIRGCNETRERSAEILLPECKKKYGADIGQKIWDLLNNVCDRMPFAVLVDESIFCVHSGVPKTSARLAKFFEIPDNLRKLQSESPLAYELLYNRPEGPVDEGCAIAGQREFNAVVFQNFLKVNDLKWMIRGHDTNVDGYKLYFDGGCITVSSCLANNHKIMVVFIDQADETLRLVHIDNENLTNDALLKAMNN